MTDPAPLDSRQPEAREDSLRPFDGILPPPSFASVETTRYCNLSCRMCIQFNDGTTKAGPHMGLEIFENVARSVFPFVEIWQPSVSGEPVMSKGFVDMFEIANRYGVKAEVVTNATLLTEKIMDAMIPNLGLVLFSFDGVDKETFEEIREGADFDAVVKNIKRLIQRCEAEQPKDQLSQFGLNCTIMERNIRDLPGLVAFAKEELGVDFIQAFHVFPVTEEMKLQSLARHVELAKECIDEAFEVAQKVGLALLVQPLDQLTAATALASSGTGRQLSSKDGIIEGLGYRDVNQGIRRPFPRFTSTSENYQEVMRTRAQAYAASRFPPRHEAGSAARQCDSIWFCDFLWNRTYIHLDGDVRPCCVFGVPVVGNLEKEPFDLLWNNGPYRAMRQSLVSKNPVPVCKGCMHIKEISDPAEINRILHGKAP